MPSARIALVAGLVKQNMQIFGGASIVYFLLVYITGGLIM